MNGLTKVVIVISLASITLASDDSRPTRIKRCASSEECGKPYCCRDRDGNLVGVNEGRKDPDATKKKGYCVKTKSQRNDICDSNCECEKGYTCYRKVSGVCCLPAKCYESKWVKDQQELGRNCDKYPDCQFPSVTRAKSRALQSLNPSISRA